MNRTEERDIDLNYENHAMQSHPLYFKLISSLNGLKLEARKDCEMIINPNLYELGKFAASHKFKQRPIKVVYDIKKERWTIAEIWFSFFPKLSAIKVDSHLEDYCKEDWLKIVPWYMENHKELKTWYNESYREWMELKEDKKSKIIKIVK